ncbi:hypothetical protein [Paenibacillus fonticola]|uniref:hypothetical protein n=1 Tax=Paenibacillus fonticola TaxID=379896 RepID=UPI00035F86E2|nr:hypothetical protein [Paenibacillus fonticola]
MHELKMAVTLEQEVVIILNSGDTMKGLPKWGADPKKVQLRTVEGSFWFLLEEIAHVTRIIPIEKIEKPRQKKTQAKRDRTYRV